MSGFKRPLSLGTGRTLTFRNLNRSEINKKIRIGPDDTRLNPIEVGAEVEINRGFRTESLEDRAKGLRRTITIESKDRVIPTAGDAALVYGHQNLRPSSGTILIAETNVEVRRRRRTEAGKIVGWRNVKTRGDCPRSPRIKAQSEVGYGCAA